MEKKMTQIQFAKNNRATREMIGVAKDEGIDVNLLKDGLPRA